MIWFLCGLLLILSLPLATVIVLVWLHYHLRRYYLHHVLRIFQEKPLFIIPRGKPIDGAEDVRFPTTHGLMLRGCYLKGRGERRGVILFGLEFGSNRWSCVPYCEHLLEHGYDVFAFEPRGQGESDRHPDYEPLQWVTDFEVADVKAALTYLKSRPDAPEGVGFFGISKGGSAGLLAAANDPYVRCFVTDGAFATYTTMVPYMRKWYSIYNSQYLLQGLLPSWYYGLIGQVGLDQIARDRGCKFPHLEPMVRRLAPRPLLMIHGGGDTYIKPEMGKALFDRARLPKEFWVVSGAKHNQALHIAANEYRGRVLEFFDRHLAGMARPQSAQPVVEPLALINAK